MTSNKVRKNRINKAIAEIEKDFCKEEIEMNHPTFKEMIEWDKVKLREHLYAGIVMSKKLASPCPIF